MNKEDIRHIREALQFGRACVQHLPYTIIGTESIDKALDILNKYDKEVYE